MYQKLQLYEVRFLIPRETEFFAITPRKLNILKTWKKHLDMSSLYRRTKSHDHMMYASWDMDATGIIFCHFGPFFALFPQYWPQKLKFEKTLPFDPPNNPKNQNFVEDIIISPLCTTKNDHMMYSSWDMECDRIFCPFTTITTWKNERNNGDTIILHLCTTNDNHMMYGFWEMECERQFFLVLDYFLPFYPPPAR